MSQIQLDVVEEREESLNLSYPSGLVVFVLFQTSFIMGPDWRAPASVLFWVKLYVNHGP